MNTVISIQNLFIEAWYTSHCKKIKKTRILTTDARFSGEQDKSPLTKCPPIMMKSKMFFFVHFFILMVLLDILKYKGKKLITDLKNLILIGNRFFTCCLLLTFICIKCKLEKKNW